MVRVGTVGSDNNRALSVLGQSLIVGATAGTAHYLVNDQEVFLLSKDTLDFAPKASEKIEDAITNSKIYQNLKNNLNYYKEELDILERPAKEAKARHKLISKEIGRRVRPLRDQLAELVNPDDITAKKEEIQNVIKRSQEELGAVAGSDAVTAATKKLATPEYAALQRNVKDVETEIRDASLRIAKKANRTTALITCAVVTTILAATAFVFDAKKKRIERSKANNQG